MNLWIMIEQAVLWGIGCVFLGVVLHALAVSAGHIGSGPIEMKPPIRQELGFCPDGYMPIPGDCLPEAEWVRPEGV